MKGEKEYSEGDMGFYGICQICNKEFGKDKLCQDHHHGTGQLRGALCRHCNFLIGFAHEDENILLSAIEYLEFWKKKRINRKKLG